MAGKTGTPQNWSDAWAVGYSPYYTAAIWFGFDKPGNSLGVNLTGSTLAGPVWADFMREVHQGLPYRDFVKPSTGIVDVKVCAKSGLLVTAACPSEAVLPFLEGTAPTRYCDMHEGAGLRSPVSIEGMRRDALFMDNSALLGELRLPELRLPEGLDPQTRQNTAAPPARTPASRSTRTRAASRTATGGGTTSPGSPSGQSILASQPALDFRGSDYEGALPPPDLAAEDPADQPGADTLPAAEAPAPELPGTGPAAPARNTRTNPGLPDEEFVLELPDYNPLLE
jgi:penicillin-binding protein 1A